MSIPFLTAMPTDFLRAEALRCSRLQPGVCLPNEQTSGSGMLRFCRSSGTVRRKPSPKLRKASFFTVPAAFFAIPAAKNRSGSLPHFSPAAVHTAPLFFFVIPAVCPACIRRSGSLPHAFLKIGHFTVFSADRLLASCRREFFSEL